MCVSTLYESEWNNNQDEHMMEIEVTLGYPCFVKPANLGSSVGISKANNQVELLPLLRKHSVMIVRSS